MSSSLILLFTRELHSDYSTLGDDICVGAIQVIDNGSYLSYVVYFVSMEEKMEEPKQKKKIIALTIVIILVSVSIQGYLYFSKEDSLFDTSGWAEADFQQPEFVLENLSGGPLCIVYRTDFAITTHVNFDFLPEKLSEDYGDQITYAEINLDHSTIEEEASYDIFDYKGTPDDPFGVPMLVFLTKSNNASDNEINYYFITYYGGPLFDDDLEEKRQEYYENIKLDLNQAIGIYNGSQLPPEG